LGGIYVLNKMDQFEQCWHVRTAALPTVPGQNPFAEAVFIADGFHVPGSPAGATARKYAMHLEKKRLQLYTDQSDRLVGMSLDDFEDKVTTGIQVKDWWTNAALSEELFEPPWPRYADCKSVEIVEYIPALLTWDLANILLGGGFGPMGGVPRQLRSV
jgi:hypothetical protein